MKIVESIEVAATPKTLFDITQDYAVRLKWDTFLKVAHLVDAQLPAPGVRVWCVARNGFAMETEYVTFESPSVTAIRMRRGPFLIRRFAGSWTFAPISELSTFVTFTYFLELRSPFGFLNIPIRALFSRNVRQRLRDLKAYAEAAPQHRAH